MITSPHNSKIQWVRALQKQAKTRRAEAAFVVEGVRLVEEAAAAGVVPQLVLQTTDLGERGMQLVDAFTRQGVLVEQVSGAVMKAAADTETPQGILAVVPAPAPALPQPPDFILLLDQMRDPGNLGTILRTASAARVQAVLLSPGSADPYAPKVVRSAMGAHFRLPLFYLEWEAIIQYLAAPSAFTQPAIYLAESEGGLEYTRADFRQPFALIIGGEAEGASHAGRQLARARLHIPMPGAAESLNAGVAAAVFLFEALRQRSIQS